MPRPLPAARVALAVPVLLAVLTGGCGLIYRQDIQQGNQIEQKDVDGLRPGMSKRQVALVIGTPALPTPFHEDRWVYVMSQLDGRKQTRETKRLTLTFQDNALVRIEGDFQPAPAAR